jgi:hypothetical protein
MRTPPPLLCREKEKDMRGQRALDGLQRLEASRWYAADWAWIRRQINAGSELLVDVEDLLDPAYEPPIKPVMLEWTMKHPGGTFPVFPPQHIDIDRLQAQRAGRVQTEPSQGG